MKVALLGGTRGMGRSLARLFAARGDSVCLLGRNQADLDKSAEDLRSRGAHDVSVRLCDLERPHEFRAVLDEATTALGGLDTVAITAAMFATQDTLENDTALVERLLAVNFTNTVLFCEDARRRLLASGGGTLCVFSSVAGDRGRKPVVIYGATKAGLSAYLEGLDHKFRADGLRTVCVKPGFVKTGMTAELKPPPFAGEPDAVGRRVLRAIDAGKPVVYAPGIWALVMFMIRHLPRTVMRKVGF